MPGRSSESPRARAEEPGRRRRHGEGARLAAKRARDGRRADQADPHGDDVAGGRYRSRSERNFELPRSVLEELRAVAGTKSAATLERRLASAAKAYERDRYREALAALRPVLEAAPASAAARELHGLTLYRLGRWRPAAKELRLVHDLTGSYDQHPVIADCERALGRLDRVKELWDELRHAGVDREVLTEGRLVMAGALADEGELEQAIELLRAESRLKRNADLSDLRQWYALADLYEQAGEVPRARELFRRVAEQAPELFDAQVRLAALR